MIKQRTLPKIILKPGREKSLLRKHPWIFSGAIQTIKDRPQAGETVAVSSSKGEFLGYGAYSPQSQITVRLWSFFTTDPINPAWFQQRIADAWGLRKRWFIHNTTTAYRLINAESDGLPGLIIDRYNNFLICQFLSAGADFWKREVVLCLEHLFPEASGIYERSDVEVRTKEGLPLIQGILSGELPPQDLVIQEGSLRFKVDVLQGHKTGFYLDQRENRQLLAQYTSQTEMLNCFSYSGGFGLWAFHGGARHVTSIDASAQALSLLKENWELNEFTVDKHTLIQGDVFQQLRIYHHQGRQFDVIVLDPPKFAENQRQLQQACRGYKDINRLAFLLLKPGGYLFTFSCSGLMSPELFQKVVADAALDAKRDALLLQRLSQASDHPCCLSFPEGHYLKGLLCTVGR